MNKFMFDVKQLKMKKFINSMQQLIISTSNAIHLRYPRYAPGLSQSQDPYNLLQIYSPVVKLKFSFRIFFHPKSQLFFVLNNIPFIIILGLTDSFYLFYHLIVNHSINKEEHIQTFLNGADDLGNYVSIRQPMCILQTINFENLISYVSQKPQILEAQK